MKVAVVGCGYVGLVTGTGLAALGHEVLGIEIDGDRRAQIAAGKAPFHEPRLDELLRSTLEEGTFRVSESFEAVKEAEAIFLAVQTPLQPNGSLNLDFLVDATSQVSHALAGERSRKVIAVRSTVLPGTTEHHLRPLVPEGLELAVNPEFLREGSAVDDFRSTDRVVIGSREAWAGDLLEKLYAPLGAPVIRTTPATAELAKCASNAFLATLISFSNEIGHIAESTLGVDAEEVLSIIHADRRFIGNQDWRLGRPEILSYLKVGCGFGGSCLPKDTKALIRYARSVGQTPVLLEAALSINEGQAASLVERANRALDGLADRRVAVLGIAFKAGTDDLRESPGLKILDELLARLAKPVIFDPLVPADALQTYEKRGVRIADSLLSALQDIEACVITTAAPEFQSVPDMIRASRDGAPLVIDGRRLLSGEGLDDSGYLAVGRFWSAS
jgi:UDPglucose 6-dehydrogenase